MRDEHRGLTPERAPARAFRAEAVSVVPKQVDLTAKSPASVLKKPITRRAIPDVDKKVEPDRPATERRTIAPAERAVAAGDAEQPKDRPGRAIARPSGNDGDQPEPPVVKPAVEPRGKPAARDGDPKRPLNPPGGRDDAPAVEEPTKKIPGRLIAPRTILPDATNDDRVTPKRPSVPARDTAADDARERALAEAAAKRRETTERERAEDAARRQKMIEDRSRSIEKQQKSADDAARRAAADRAEDTQRNAAAQRAAEARERAMEQQRRAAAERQAEASNRAVEARRQQAAAEAARRNAEAARERATEAPRRVVPTRPPPVNVEPRVIPSRPVPPAAAPRLIPSGPSPAVRSNANPAVVPKKGRKDD
jgi:colicin import membrane protein